MSDEARDEELAFTVATVWREQRVSCPHPDILRSYAGGGLDPGAREFLTFHLEEADCPYCGAVLDDLNDADSRAQAQITADAKDRILRSTVTEVRRRASQR